MVLSAAAVMFLVAPLANAIDCRGQEAQQLASSVTLLLGSGRLMLEQELRSRQSSVGTPVEMQLVAVHVALDLLCSSEDAATGARASSLFPASTVLPWLATVTRAVWQVTEQDGIGQSAGGCLPAAHCGQQWLCMMRAPAVLPIAMPAPRPCPSAGTHLPAMETYAAVCSRLLGHLPSNAFSSVQAALAADAALKAQLVRLLRKHGLRAAASRLLPSQAQRFTPGFTPGWQPPAAASHEVGKPWRHLAETIMSLSALSGEFMQQLKPRQEASAVRRLAVLLIEALPLDRPANLPPTTYYNGWKTLIMLFQGALWAQREWHLQPPLDAAQQAAARQASWTVLRLLPKLAGALRLVCGDPTLACPGRLTCCDLVALLCVHLTATGGVESAAEAAQLLAAADAAIGLLPLAHEVWQQRQAAGRQLPDADAKMAHVCLQLAALAYLPLSDAYGQGAKPPGSAAEHATAATAARRLQLSSCRLLHWAVSAADPTWMQSLGTEHSSLTDLQDTMAVASRAATLVTEAEEARVADDRQQLAALRFAGSCVCVCVSRELALACFACLLLPRNWWCKVMSFACCLESNLEPIFSPVLPGSTGCRRPATVQRGGRPTAVCLPSWAIPLLLPAARRPPCTGYPISSMFAACPQPS